MQVSCFVVRIQVVCFLFMFMYLLVPKTSFTRLPLCSANGGKIIICGPPLSVIPLCCVVFFFFSLFTNVGLVVTYPFFPTAPFFSSPLSVLFVIFLFVHQTKHPLWGWSLLVRMQCTIAHAHQQGRGKLPQAVAVQAKRRTRERCWGRRYRNGDGVTEYGHTRKA